MRAAWVCPGHFDGLTCDTGRESLPQITCGTLGDVRHGLGTKEKVREVKVNVPALASFPWISRTDSSS